MILSKINRFFIIFLSQVFLSQFIFCPNNLFRKNEVHDEGIMYILHLNLKLNMILIFMVEMEKKNKRSKFYFIHYFVFLSYAGSKAMRW